MKIFITGGSGYIGRQLSRELADRGHLVTILSRSRKSSNREEISFLQGNPLQNGSWQESLQQHDAVINLAGSSVFCRWNSSNKQRIEESRILTTRNVVDAINGSEKVKILLSGSAIGYYGDTGDQEISEKGQPGRDFLAGVAHRWELAAAGIEDPSVRIVFCRIGIVLGRSGGALAKMLPVFRMGLGSALGNGQQWFSWVHEEDLVRALCFILDQEDISGPVNLTAPNPVTNLNFSKSLAAALGRPFFMPSVPVIILKYALGETAALVLDSQKILPNVLLSHNFSFHFAAVDKALDNILGPR